MDAIRDFQRVAAEAFTMTRDERMLLCDMGFYNDVIRGYLITAMERTGIPREWIGRALVGLTEALDDTTAAEAEELGR